MRIALLSNELYPLSIGGMQKHSYYLARNLAQKGVKVDLYFHRPDNQESKNKLMSTLSDNELKGITFHEIDVPSSIYFPGHYMFNSYRYSVNVFKNLKNQLNSIDFVYVQGFNALKLLKEKNNLKKCPPIGINFHGIEMFQGAANMTANFEKHLFRSPAVYCLRRSDVAFSLGGKLTGILKKRVGNSTKILETPIGLEKKWLNDKLKSHQGKRKFIFVGRYERRKGIQELNEAIKKLNADYSFDFEFIGPIPEKKRLNAKNCHYYGAIYDEDKMIDIISTADVLVCPSYSEGMPTVILEAMARGLAVIATNVGAVSELVSTKNGWLIEPANQNQLEESLIHAITLSESQLYKKREFALKLIQEKFTWDDVVEQTLFQIQNYLSTNKIGN